MKQQEKKLREEQDNNKKMKEDLNNKNTNNKSKFTLAQRTKKIGGATGAVGVAQGSVSAREKSRN